ncbi:MAG TPA: C69 family dipeptidase [Chthonomonadaceae bacterium]|nr:C69 family dipeptidase [Chthonomonadaceae bacterium]
MLKSCDTMVALGNATANGQTLFAKNSDRPANECQPLVLHKRRAHPPGTLTQCQFVELPEVSTTYRHIGSRPCWCWGYEHGFNEHQVAIGNEGLHSRFSFDEPKLIGMELVRLGLERARTAAEAVEVMTDLITRYGQGAFKDAPLDGKYDNGYLVADPHEAYVIETAGHQWAVKRVEETVGISNVYSLGTDWDRLSPEAEQVAAARGWRQPEQGRLHFAATFSEEGFRWDGVAQALDLLVNEVRRHGVLRAVDEIREEIQELALLGSGARRRARSCAVLAQKEGAIDAATMMALLSDHATGTKPTEPFQTQLGAPGGICIHYDDEKTGTNTAASLVADLCADGSRLPVYWCSFYSPCLGVFLPIFLEGDLPPILSVGGAEPDAESPWWQFRRLSRAVRARPEERVGTVRQEWAEMQGRLLRSAYDVAAEGRRLIDAGREEAAGRLVADYMNENVTEMRARISRMLKEFALTPGT